MKKIFYILLIISSISNAQEFSSENKTLTGVFEVKDKTKPEIFNLINKWIALNYNSSKNVIQLNDIESGAIVVKGIDIVKFINPVKEIKYKNEKYSSAYQLINYYYTLEINIKDNKFRMIYDITSISETYLDVFLNVNKVIPEELIFNCLSFNEVDPKFISSYNAKLENFYQGKSEKKTKEREQIILSTKPMFLELTSNLNLVAKETMLSIYKDVIGNNSKW
jgi:hypothetical protein